MATEATDGDLDGIEAAAAPPTATRRRTDRHPLLQDWPQGKWCPAAVGKVSGYPRTAVEYARRRAQLRLNRAKALRAGRLTRHGVPNGWAGRKDEIAEVRRNSRTAAERLSADLQVRGIWKPDNVQAAFAMRAVLEIALSPLNRPVDRLDAMRVVLKYTQPAPVARRIMSGNPLGFLQGLVDTMGRR